MTLQPIDNAKFVLTVKVTIAASDEEKFLELYRPVYNLVLNEPECVFFIFGKQDNLGQIEFPTNPTAEGAGSNCDEPKVTVFQWSEGWSKDLDWFMREQITKPYYGPYFEATMPMFVKPREAEIYIPEHGLNNFKI